MSAANKRAYRIIRDKIGDGSFVSGARLKEAELVKVCGVSRTPVREALRRLESEGLVTLTPNSGAVVASWNERELLDLYSVRAKLEGLAAGMAAERRTLDDLEEMTRVARQMGDIVAASADQPDHDAIAVRNAEFHALILNAARSRALSTVAVQVMDAPLMTRTFRRYTRSELQRSVKQHYEIIDAIRAGDHDWASAAMTSHIKAGFNALSGPTSIKEIDEDAA